MTQLERFEIKITIFKPPENFNNFQFETWIANPSLSRFDFLSTPGVAAPIFFHKVGLREFSRFANLVQINKENKFLQKNTI